MKRDRIVIEVPPHLKALADAFSNVPWKPSVRDGLWINARKLVAIAVGTTIGASVGGTIGGCPLDVVPVVPIIAMGPLPSQPLTFLASVSLVPGMSLGIQVITKDTSSNTWDTANTEIINSL
jgi:hypothetical protein